LNEDRNVLDLHVSVLLRGLVPFRRLTYQESLYFAEQQAAVLLKLVHVYEPPVLVEELVQEVGLALEVRDDPTQNTPGRSFFDHDRGEWIMSLNLELGHLGRGFVIAHEVKHILDDGFGPTLYRPVDIMTTSQRQEYVAQYFAACLVMPRLWIGRGWRQEGQSIEAMAIQFGVTPACMQLRLEAMGLLDDKD
jgi:Zn-dependent peptidase ImmA (M78 family)